MAKLYFDASDTSLTISNSNTEVIGLSGTGVQSVTIAQDVTNVTLRQNVEKLVLNGASSAFKYQQAGATLKIYKTDGTTLVATVPVQGGSADIDGDGTLITFTNGTASAKLTSGVMSLGGTTVSTTIGDVTPTLTGGATPITFSLDKDSYDVVEGQTLTFTIKASAPVQSATTVRYNIAGDKSVVGQEATAGTDFSPASASLSFASGESEKVVTITVPNDGATEGFEGMKISLLSSSFSLLDSALATIEDGPELAKIGSLTTSGDTFQGTSLGDTIYASIALTNSSLSSTETTLNTNDTVAGGLGIDILNVSARGSLAGNVVDAPVATITGVEKIYINSDVTSGTGFFGVDLASTDTGITNVGVNSAFSNQNGAVVFRNVPTNVDVLMRGQGDLQVGFLAGVMAGSGDTLDLTLNGVGTDNSSSGTSVFAVGGGGVETLHITSDKSTASTATANYLELFSTLMTGSSGYTPMQGLQTVTIDGSQGLYLDLNNTTGSLTVMATGLSGNLTLEGISTGAVTLQGGAGNDSFDFSTGGGTGTSFDAGTGTAADSVVGGDGIDTIKIGATGSVTDAQFKNASSIETLTLGSGATGTLGVNADTAGIVTVNEGTGTNDNIKLTVSSGFDNALTVQLYGTGVDTVDVSASQSTLTVKGTLANLTGDTLTAGTGTGTTDILSLTTDGSTGTLGANVTHFEKIVLEGASSGLTLTTNNANVASGATLTIDASAITSSTASFNFTGSAETDGKFSILGGAGNDTFYLGAGNDTAAGGDGADIIYGSGGGNDSLLGGAGNDTINMGSGLSSGDTIDGGDGSDTLQVSSSAVSSTDFANVTGIETLKLAAAAVTLSGNISFTTFDLTDTGSTTTLTLASGYTNATTVQLGSGDAVVNTAHVTLTGTLSESHFAATGGTIAMTGGTGIDTLLLTTASGTTGELVLATGAKIDVITLIDGTGTGDAGADIRITATGYASSLRIDASELDAGGTGTGAEDTLDEVLYFNGSSASGAFTVLGGAGADQMSGGSGADSLDGGAGNDLILGAAGDDKLLGNDGADTLISGTGNDSINGGAGNDRIILGDSTGTATAGYMDNADTLNGGDGTDTLVVSASGAAFTFSYSNTSSIEVLELQGSGAGSSTGTATLLSQAQTAGIATVKLGDHSNFSVSATSYTSGLTYDLNGNTGAVSLDGGAGDDIFLIKGTGVLAIGDTLGGADGTDIIRLDNGTGAGTTVSVAIGDGVKKIERIEVADNSTGSAGATVTISTDAFASGDTVIITASDLDATEAFSLMTATGNAKAAFSVIGGAGNDTLTGGGKADTLSGGAGNDSLSGGAGNDTVNGGDAADTLVASDGNDTLTGGAGSDYFFFGSGSSTRDNDKIDTVADFSAGDKLVFDDVARTLTGGSLDLSSGLNKGIAGSIGDAAGLTTAAGQYIYISGSKQLAVDLNGNGQLTATDGDYMVILTDSTGIASADVLINFDVTLSSGVSASATGGAGTDTLFFSTGAASTGTISGFESVVGSTGADTIVLGATGMSVTVVGSGGADSITGSSGADTITLGGGSGETGYLFGATGTGYDFDANFGKSGADVINLGTGTSDNDTIVFGTGELSASGLDNTLTLLNFDMGAASDKLDLTQFDLTGFANTGGASGWYELSASGADLVATGDGSSGRLVFAYGSGLSSGDISTSSSSSGNIVLSTGDVDNFVILASGSSDTTLDVYYVNAAADASSGSFSDNDIKLVGTISLISGDTAASVDSSNFSL